MADDKGLRNKVIALMRGIVAALGLRGLAMVGLGWVEIWIGLWCLLWHGEDGNVLG